MREVEAMIIDTLLQPTEFRNWKTSFKSEVCQSSQYPRAAMLWVGIDEFFTSASRTGRPTPDFENLDFKMASRRREIAKGNLRNMSPKQKAKLTPKRDHLRADRLLGWSTTSSKLVATMKTSWPSEIYQKVYLKNDHVQAFYTKWDEVLSAVTDRPTDNMLESLYKMQVEKSEELKYLVQVYVQETAIGDKKYDSCRLQLMAKKISRAQKSRILISKREIETRSDLQ